MSKYSFIEDAYIDFARSILINHYVVDPRDIGAINNFYIKISNNDSLTEAQARYIVKLMSKYQLSVKPTGVEYGEILKTPKWKKEFRVLDLSKKVFVEEGQEKNPVVCLKFPYTFKAVFEKEFLGKFSKKIGYEWDNDRRVNLIDLYDINLVLLQDFCNQHNFEIDESFLDAVSQVEEIWNNQDEILPFCFEQDGQILLKNVSEDAAEYWKNNSHGNYHKDLFLAKTMGLICRLNEKPKDAVEAVASHIETNFWINNFQKFFDFYKKLDERVAVILDSSKETINWLEEFVHAADEAHVSRSDIKICFREDKNENANFNEWVKDNGLGGKIDNGKIFVFRSKPAKWLLTEDKNVKIIVTNGLFPSMNTTTQRWIRSKPCVIHLGTIKASQTKDIEIVQV